MAIALMVVIGLVAGGLAKLIMPGKDPSGIIATMVVGVAGALAAGLLGRQSGWYAPDESAGIIASVIGAVVLLAVYRLLVGRRAARSYAAAR